MIREAILEAANKIDANGSKKNSHSREDKTGIPLVFFHVPADETGWEGREGDFEPIGVVLEETPAHVAERHLDEIDEGLRDKKENENFKGGVERGFAIHDDEDSGEDPPFGGDSDVVEGIAVRNKEGHEGGVDTHDDGKNNQFRPGKIKTAEELVKEILMLLGSILRVFRRFGGVLGGFG